MSMESIDDQSKSSNPDDDLAAKSANNSPGKGKSSKANDSPAFRLRPRRSTPRKCQETLTGINVSTNKRYNLYADKKFRYSIAKPARRILFPSTSADSGTGSDLATKSHHIISKIIGTSVAIQEPEEESQDSIEFTRKIFANKQNCPAKSDLILFNVELGVFAKRFRLIDLNAGDSASTSGHYLSVRIVHKCQPDECKLKQITCTDAVQSTSGSAIKPSHDHSNERIKCNDKSKTCNHEPTKKCVRILTQEVNQNVQGTLWKPKQPLLLIHLYDMYADYDADLQPGKIVDIIRFEHESIDEHQLHFEHLGQRMKFWPFVLHIRAQNGSKWSPLISIRDHTKPLDEQNLIVQNGQCIKQSNNAAANDTDNKNGTERKAAMKFSSYVVKIESNEETISLQQTKSPTIKRFMKRISRDAFSNNDKTPIKIKIKRNLS